MEVKNPKGSDAAQYSLEDLKSMDPKLGENVEKNLLWIGGNTSTIFLQCKQIQKQLQDAGFQPTEVFFLQDCNTGDPVPSFDAAHQVMRRSFKEFFATTADNCQFADQWGG